MNLPHSPDETFLAAVRAAGHRLWIEDGVVLSDDDAAVQAISDMHDWLAGIREKRKGEVRALAEEKRLVALAKWPTAERDSWPSKMAAVAAWAGQEPSTQAEADAIGVGILFAEAAARGLLIREVVQRINDNAAALSVLSGAIDGASGKHRDKLDALTDYDAIRDYDITTDWPI